MRKVNLILVAMAMAAVVLAVSEPAAADVIGGSVTGGSAQVAGGTFVLLTAPLPNLFGPPDSVGNDNFQSPDLFAFAEAQNVLLTAPLAVNGSTIAAGTVVSRYYVFFRPRPNAAGRRNSKF